MDDVCKGENERLWRYLGLTATGLRPEIADAVLEYRRKHHRITVRAEALPVAGNA